MYIRELELSGFKSFVNKTRLEFTPRLTAVIGPNGSGKSNLVDAMRWVLGEHNSRLLRASRMEEVIFNGSKHHKPLGRAEVSLTIDNSQGELPVAFREVRFSRRLFRSGEAEYSLNGAACRLRDIQRLLWDTGLGRQGFAIVGQGQVEEMLAASPEERRQFLEEAAGIVRHRNRRREAEQKLSETRGNLQRLSDIMADQASQLASLEREVSLARAYQELQQKISEAEKRIAFSRLRRLEARFRQLKDKLNQVEVRKAGVEAQVAELEAALTRKRCLAAELARERERLLSEQLHTTLARQEAQLRLEAALSEAGTVQAEIDRLAQDSRELEKRLELVDGEIASTSTELERMADRHYYLDEVYGKALDKLASAEAELRQAQELREKKQAALYDLMQEILDTQNRLRTLEAEWQASRARGQRLHAERERLREEMADLDLKLVPAAKRFSDAQEELQELEGAAKALSERLDEARRYSEHARQEVEQVRHSFKKHRDRLANLREWQEARESYSQGVKAVLAARSSLGAGENGILGVVAELITVPAKLETAIEAALGGALQNIVVASEDDAQRAIAYLKKGALGRATFLPLDAIRPRRLSIDRSILTWAGVLGIGSEIVGAREGCTALVPHLLGDLLIVTRLDLALAVARRLGHRTRIATLEGELLQPGGAVTGGSARNRRTGLLSRLREIGELEAVLKQETVELEAKHSESEKWAEAVVTGEKEEKAAKEKLWAARTGLDRAETLLGDLTKKKSQLENRMAVVDDELARWENDFAAPTRERESVESWLKALLLHQDLLAKKEQTSPVDIQELEDRRAQLLAEVEESRRKLAEVEQREERIRGSLSGLEQVRNRYTAEQAQLDQRLEAAQARSTAVQAAVAEKQEEAERQRAAEEELNCRLADLDIPVAEAAQAIASLEKSVQQATSRMKGLERDLGQIRADLGSVVAEQKAQTLWLEQQFGWAETDGIPAELEGEETPQEQLDLWRLEAKGMEPVNLGVIQEYNHILERHQYYLRQAEDLRQAQSALNGVVVEVEKLMEDRLRNTLTAVNRELERIFPVLFGGGMGRLQPTSEGRLQDGGLEMEVQLPGKRVHSLSLLSGGERAMAALSLLFALLQVKPSPFCVLDEIDASLDEANVERFARFLRQTADRQQFIIISHRAGTVEQAECVYGVTMEEEGVSRLVSMRAHGSGENRTWNESAG